MQFISCGSILHSNPTRKMPLRSSSVIPQWAAKLSSPRCSRRTTSSSAADSTTSQAENSNDSLVIEDLDLGDLDLSQSTVKSSSASPDEAPINEFVLFPEVSANNLFGEQIPAVVSEACLMNDLYILVKVPSNPNRHVPTSSASSQTSPKSTRLSPNLCQNHRIFPIQEEEEEHSVQESKSKIPVRWRRGSDKHSHWVKGSDELEEFPSTTNIIRCNDIVPLPNQVPEQPEVPLFEVSCRRESPPLPSLSLPSCQNQIELQEINLNSSRFQDRANITLENYGILITPTKTPRTENLLVFQVDTEPKEKTTADSSSCFEWFTKFFRRKRRRNGFVHAKVYKTYFVKWKKCSEDAECTRCQCRPSKDFRRNSA